MMMGFGLFGVLLFFFLIIGVAIVLVSLLFPRPSQPLTDYRSQPPHRALTPSKAALDILKQRYARGELSKAEYEAMKEEILAT
ncbi:MAG: SHOCT domain-containing protein [Chloroflexi bacterium]|nr:SHOCT domain-containing protein [Chloroflexota bacterium]